METQEKKFVPASKQIPTVNSGWLDRELGEAMSEAVVPALLTVNSQKLLSSSKSNPKTSKAER
ncbi:TPA: hypothetical protein ACJMER_001857 [Neisseria meningitidis]